MTYQATNFLAGLFGRTTPTATLTAERNRQPEPTANPATSGESPNPGGEPQADDLATSGIDPGEWHRQPDARGRMGWQRRDLDPADWPDFGELPDVPPCPTCGSLKAWQSMAADLHGIAPGRWRCLKCNPPTKSRAWAAKAAELRRNGATSENRAPDGPRVATEATGPARETLAASDP